MISTACYVSTNLSHPCSSNTSLTQVFNPLAISKNNNGGLALTTISHRSGVLRKTNKNSRELVVHATAETGDLLSGVIPFLPSGEDSWISWAVGLGVTVPLITTRLLAVTKQVSVAAEMVEKVAEVVEKVADDVRMAAVEFAAKLPEGGKLKDIVQSIKHLAEETEKDAQVVEDLMHKVEEVDEKLEAFLGGQLTIKVPNSRKLVVCCDGSLPSPPSSNPLNGWVIGILLSIALPFFRVKWGSLLQFKNKVEDVIETVEDVIDGVEKVAEKIDDVAEHIESVLPESQLKNFVKAVEDFSEDTAAVAHAAGDFIDQLQGEDVELVEEVVDDLPKEKLKDLSEKTAKVAHAAEDLKDKVQEVKPKSEEISEKSLVESVKEEVDKSL